MCKQALQVSDRKANIYHPSWETFFSETLTPAWCSGSKCQGSPTTFSRFSPGKFYKQITRFISGIPHHLTWDPALHHLRPAVVNLLFDTMNFSSSLSSSSSSSNLLLSGQRAGASGDRLPGIPVGSHPDQLSPHHRCHPWPVWNNSVQAQICYWGGLHTHVRRADACTHTHTHIQEHSLESHFTSSALDLATASH